MTARLGLLLTPLSEGISLQKRLCMTRVVDGFHSFTCTPTRLSTNGMDHTSLCFPAEAGRHLPTREERKAELA